MTEYIPTTEVVREDFADFRRNDYFWKSRESLMRRSARRRRQFDRWFASVKAEAIAEFIDETGVAVDGVRPLLAKAWDEGHKHSWRRGPDGCQCYAYSSSECACGDYGTGELLSLKDNPYREETE